MTSIIPTPLTYKCFFPLSMPIILYAELLFKNKISDLFYYLLLFKNNNFHHILALAVLHEYYIDKHNMHITNVKKICFVCCTLLRGAPGHDSDNNFLSYNVQRFGGNKHKISLLFLVIITDKLVV